MMNRQRVASRRTSEYDHALAALYGVAIGDALGMPSQTWSRDVIAVHYGFIADFISAAGDQPVSANLPPGTVTDDTEQTLLIAEHLVQQQGGFDEHVWAAQLLEWERGVRSRGVEDLLGPSTRRAIEALQHGTPASETGRYGTTNGAAMRIVPVAIATRPEPIGVLVDRVELSCRLTHNTSEAIAAAAAVAAFVSAGIAGAALPEAMTIALDAARVGETRGEAAVRGSIASVIEEAWRRAETPGRDGSPALHESHPRVQAAYALAERIGTSVAAIEAVPMAFALVRLANADPWTAAVLAANIGDDTDTIGAITCAMCAAIGGMASLPAMAVARVVSVNTLELEPIVDALLLIRGQPVAKL